MRWLKIHGGIAVILLGMWLIYHIGEEYHGDLSWELFVSAVMGTLAIIVIGAGILIWGIVFSEENE